MILLKSEALVDVEDIEIYQFGLECLLLKAVHITSYFLIGICMRELFSLIVSGSILIPLRRKIGGYHAKTRVGCYVFSCMFVYILCMLNKIIWRHEVGIMGMILAEILIFHFAPVENENRMLELQEKMLFRKQAIQLLITVNVIISIIFLIHKYLFLAYWLEKGVIFTGILLVLGLKR